MADKKVCYVITGRGATKPTERQRVNWLLTEIIRPVINENFPDFEVYHQIVEEPLDIFPRPRDFFFLAAATQALEADLVIADFYDATPTDFHNIAIRQTMAKPTVFVSNQQPTGRPALDRRPRRPTRVLKVVMEAPVIPVRTALMAEIERVLATDEISPPLTTPPAPKQSRIELAQRIDTVANAIACLRINSVAEHVQQLREISQEIRGLPDDTSRLNDLATSALSVVSRLFDELGTQQGAQVIIAGAVAGILGATGGFASASIFALTLAAWKGKDAFMAALAKYRGRGKSARKKGGSAVRKRRSKKGKSAEATSPDE